jgi:hypothetical protein
MKKLLKLSALLPVVVLAASAAKNGAFEWPDSSHYWRVLMDVGQQVEFYLKNHPDYFSHDKLITNFAIFDVPPGGQDQAAREYKKIRKELESRGMVVGSYVSGTTVIPESEQNHYPPANVSIEQMPPDSKYVGSWPGHDTRKIVNLADVKTRHAIDAGIKQLWERFPAPVVFVDNMPAPPGMANSQPWETTCNYIEELGKIAESQGSRLLFNMPMHVGELSEQQTQQLIHAVGQNGISLEMPWHANIRKDKAATERARKRYRELLDSGMAIVMTPVHTPEDQLAAWVRTWRKPTDHLYIASSFFKRPDMSVYMLQ